MSHCVQQDLVRVWCPYSMFECQLCMEEFESPRVFPCQHIFCRNCVSILIARSLRARNVDDGKLKCPVCRRPLKLDSAKSSNTEELLENFPESLLLKSFLEYKGSGLLKSNDACVGTDINTQQTTSSSQTEYRTQSAFTQTELESCTTSSQTEINSNMKSTQTRGSLKTISSQTECKSNTKSTQTKCFTNTRSNQTESLTGTISTQTDFPSLLDVVQLLCLCIKQHVRALIADIQRLCTLSVLLNCFWKHKMRFMCSILMIILVIGFTYTSTVALQTYEPELRHYYKVMMNTSEICFIGYIVLLVEVCCVAYLLFRSLVLLVRDAFILTRSVFKIPTKRLRTDEIAPECVHDDNPSYDDSHFLTRRYRRFRKQNRVRIPLLPWLAWLSTVKYLYSITTRRQTRRGDKHKTTYIKQ